ncbi:MULTISPECIES: VOC family protein [unclassified Burkholderia]|uniref:VOC family protein n=1 Tax=unclassified Burkholderia TaxID=2613784 RepID=UPI0016238249|nr:MULTISPECIES: VOC family protein [unclassified Burkholderia]
MTIGNIGHVAIRAIDLDTTVAFYRDALGFVPVPRPGSLTSMGAWLAAPGTRESAVLHVYGGRAAADECGQVSTDNARGTVDHIAFQANGLGWYRVHFERLDLTFKEQNLDDGPIWQLFVHDPNGIKLELSFRRATEIDFPISIPTQRRYTASERFFDPCEYERFGAALTAQTRWPDSVE